MRHQSGLSSKRSSTARVLKSGFLSFLALALISSCGQDQTRSQRHRFVMECGPSDQHASYLNPLYAQQVVKVRYDSRFTEEEKEQIRLALGEWNDYSQEVRSNRVLFEAEEATTVSTTSIPSNTEDCGFEASADGYGVVLVDNDATWESLGLTKANPAVTVRCSKDRDFVSKQVILVNVNITRSATAFGKFKTILKHEMGHTVGLDHSCDPNGDSSEFIGCSQVSETGRSEYYEAVMFPFIRTEGLDGLYARLNRNDRERASCILGMSP